MNHRWEMKISALHDPIRVAHKLFTARETAAHGTYVKSRCNHGWLCSSRRGLAGCCCSSGAESTITKLWMESWRRDIEVGRCAGAKHPPDFVYAELEEFEMGFGNGVLFLLLYVATCLFEVPVG